MEILKDGVTPYQTTSFMYDNATEDEMQKLRAANDALHKKVKMQHAAIDRLLLEKQAPVGGHSSPYLDESPTRNLKHFGTRSSLMALPKQLNTNNSDILNSGKTS